MSELGRVISSTALADVPTGPVGEVCPRTSLGMACLKDQYQCLCQTVEAYEVETTWDNGSPVAVNLVMQVPSGGAQPVMTGIKLTGFVASMAATNRAVRAVFNLGKPQNHELKVFVSEQGL